MSKVYCPGETTVKTQLSVILIHTVVVILTVWLTDVGVLPILCTVSVNIYTVPGCSLVLGILTLLFLLPIVCLAS